LTPVFGQFFPLVVGTQRLSVGERVGYGGVRKP
jgi:hypothetical protein